MQAGRHALMYPVCLDEKVWQPWLCSHVNVLPQFPTTSTPNPSSIAAAADCLQKQSKGIEHFKTLQDYAVDAWIHVAQPLDGHGQNNLRAM